MRKNYNNTGEGYNNRSKKRLQKTHPNLCLFVDPIRKEVDTIHDMIRQIHSGMQPRTKRSKTRIAERRIVSSTIESRHVIYYADFLVLLRRKNWKIIRCDRLHLTFNLLITPCSSVSKEHFSDRTISTRTIFRRTFLFKGTQPRRQFHKDHLSVGHWKGHFTKDIWDCYHRLSYSTRLPCIFRLPSLFTFVLSFFFDINHHEPGVSIGTWRSITIHQDPGKLVKQSETCIEPREIEGNSLRFWRSRTVPMDSLTSTALSSLSEIHVSSLDYRSMELRWFICRVLVQSCPS